MNKTALPAEIQTLTQKIVNFAKPEKIILFGSYAWGNPNSDSDADILVVQKSTEPRREREIKLRTCLRSLGIPFDLFVYTPEELKQSVDQHKNLFLKDILNNGIILYANDKIRGGLDNPRE